MIIESHEEHKLALVQLEFLMQVPNAQAHCVSCEEEGRWLEILSAAIEAYELIHFPIPDPTTEEAAAFRAAEEPKK